jgi:hypothetical protein
MQPAAPLREARARQLRLLPRAARGRTAPLVKLDSRAPVPAAALRVLRRLRGLRRDAVHQAADAALRRPALIANATGCSSIYGGNLPTTPYTATTRRPRPGVGQLALRGQRRVRPGHAAPSTQHRGARELLRSLAAQLGDELAEELLGRPARREPASPQRAHRRRPAASRSSHGSTTPRRRRSIVARRLPREEERVDRRWRRLGLRHRLRRARPRARHRAAT